MSRIHTLILGVAFFPVMLQAAVAPLTEATFTRVIRDVKVGKGTQLTPAHVSDLFKSPDVVRTSANSLAELTAADKTITRVGANTVFSFSDSGRTVKLQQGSLLFHSPKGKGGGTIKTGGAAAAVLGTTLIVSATTDGGFKIIVLEGKAQVTLPGGNFRQVSAGQLLFVLPGDQEFGPLLDINLGTLVKGSRLVSGFPDELPSSPKIELEVERQEAKLEKGEVEDTHELVGSRATKTEVEIETESSGHREDSSNSTLTPLQVAIQSNVRVQSSTLASFVNSQLFLTRSSLTLPPFGADDYVGLLGADIRIDAPSVLLPDSGLGEFEFVAAGKLTLDNITGPSIGSIQFVRPTGLMGAYDLELIGADGVDLGTTSFLSYSGPGSGNLFIKSGQDILLDRTGTLVLQNSGGGIGMWSTGQIEVKRAAFDTASLGLSAVNDLIIDKRADISLPGTIRLFGDQVFFDADDSSPLLVSATQFSVQGPVTDTAGLLTAYNAAVRPATSIEMNFVTFTTAATQVRLDAQTITLEGVELPSNADVVLRTALGLANIDNGVQTGKANLIDVLIGGSPATISGNVSDITHSSPTAVIRVQQLP